MIESLEVRRLFVNSVWAFPGADGHMLYEPRALGDHIQDYSTAGYMGGTAVIPNVAVKATVSPVAGDNTTNIQDAINAVSALPQDSAGIRGAVLLNPGTYPIDGVLNINASGVVLRGSGTAATILYATTNTSTAQRTIINVNGSNSRSTSNTQTITDKYVPVGAISFTVANASGFAVGDTVMVHRPSTQQWINDLGMNLLDNPWAPGSKDIDMDRTITHIDGNVITIDAPITQALELKYTDAAEGPNTIYKYTASGRLSNVGIEYIGGISQYDPAVTDPSDGPVDENHPWIFLNIDGAINSWARNLYAQHFAYAAVSVTNSKYVTVQDSEDLDPVSQITGGRRYSFNIDSSQDVLFRNCYTREGRHDFVEGSTVTGPNVFVDDRADNTHADAGPHHRYSTAALWDNVKAGQINIQDRGNSGTGHGHSGANQVVWNSAASFIVQSPVTAQNWLIGSMGTVGAGGGIGFHTPGLIDLSGPSGTGVNVATRSLYYQQLGERMAYENFLPREIRVGDADAFVNDGAIDNVAVDGTWKSSIQAATGKTGVGFDTFANNQLVPFTLNYNIDPGTYIVGASLHLGLKSAGGASSGDTIYIEDKSRTYTWNALGVAAPTTTEDGLVIDLSKMLAALQDGKLNLAILGNTAVDWATLQLQTASTTQPNTTTLTASEDATVQDGTNANTNFGNATSLQTKLDAVNNNQEAFLKFDVTSLGSPFITRATVRLVPTTVGYAPNTFASGKGAIFNRLSFVSSDTWTEGTINWNNKPAADAAFAEYISKANAPLNIDVTSLVRAAQAGDKKLSLKLLSAVQDAAGQISYASSENGTVSLRPQLIISSYGSALTPVADAYVRSGASGNTNFGATNDLQVKKDNAGGTGDNNRESFVKFDVTGIASAPAGATLRFMPIGVNTTVAPLTADYVGTDSWTEAGITWNTKPAPTTALGSAQLWQDTPIKFNVTTQAAAAIGGADKVISTRLATNTINTNVNYFASNDHADKSLVPLLILKNLGPQITVIENQSSSAGVPVSGEWFGIWDAETAASSLVVSATSSNTTLLPNANITFGGSGGDRTFTLTPAAGQAGSTNVTITVTDGQGLTATSVFSFIVSNSLAINGDQSAPGEPDVIRVVRSGAFVDVYRNNIVTPAFHIDYATSPQLLINTLDGGDSITIDYTGGNPIPAAGLIVDGGNGNDTLSVVGSSAADAVALTTGAVSVNGGQFTYGSTEELNLALGISADTLSAGGNSSVTASVFALNVTGGGSVSMSAGTLPDFTDLLVNSATFNLSGLSQTINTLTGNGTVADNNATAATLSVGQGGGSGTFGGVLSNGASGVLSLTKAGAGTLTLGGANTFTGLTTIAGGVVAAGASANLVGLAGQVRFNGGTLHVTGNSTAANLASKFTTSFTGATAASTGTFDIDAGVTLTIGGANTSLQTNGGGAHGGVFTKTGAGTLRIVGNNGQLDDALKLNAGTVIAESATALGGADTSANRLDMKNGTTLVLRQDTGTNFLTPISVVDAGATVNVIIDRQTNGGAGVTHLLNGITAAGAFTLHVTAGTNIGSGAAGLSLGTVALSGTGTFDIVDGAGAVTTNVSVTGAVNGAFALNKTSDGLLTLSGANTYTGATTVSGGTLTLASGASLASAALTAAPGATLNLNGAVPASASVVANGVVNFAGNTTTAPVTRTLASIAIGAGGSVKQLASTFAGSPMILNVPSVTFSNSTSILDLTNNELLTSATLSSIRARIVALQLFSSSSGGAVGSLDLGGGQAEARYTLLGDTNLDGKVDVTDLGNMASSYGTASGAVWEQGDSDNNGTVDVNDLGNLASYFGASLATGNAVPTAMVAAPANALSSSPPAARTTTTMPARSIQTNARAPFSDRPAGAPATDWSATEVLEEWKRRGHRGV